MRNVRLRKDAFLIGFSWTPHSSKGFPIFYKYYTLWLGFIEIDIYAGKLIKTGGK